jgi:hypothetical protein
MASGFGMGVGMRRLRWEDLRFSQLRSERQMDIGSRRCHAERRSEKREAILTAESKHLLPSPGCILEVKIPTGSFLESNRLSAGRLFERVHDLQAVDVAGVLHIF